LRRRRRREQLKIADVALFMNTLGRPSFLERDGLFMSIGETSRGIPLLRLEKTDLRYLLRFDRIDTLGAYSIPVGDRPSHSI
jgi:hypothetical protein